MALSIKCHYAACRDHLNVMLGIFMLKAVMLSLILLNVVVLNVVVLLFCMSL
jgi:hypothetical protein